MRVIVPLAGGRDRNGGWGCLLVGKRGGRRQDPAAGGAAMRTRDKDLERLRVASPCESSWEAMRGDGRRRYCAECERHVYDFAHLTAREAAGLVEATGGALCARLTRDGAGRLVTLAPPATEPLG